MTKIPQVTRAMREILTTTADEAAHATRFVQRTFALGGAAFSQTLVFERALSQILRRRS